MDLHGAVRSLNKISYRFRSSSSRNPTSSLQEDEADVQRRLAHLLATNAVLHARLNDQKECITRYARNRKWDRFKKHCNEYELVCSSIPGSPSICAMNPISRSFFKLWESMFDYRLARSREPMCAVFLAEGPGGFVQAFSEWRRSLKEEDSVVVEDEAYGMTLLSRNHNVPDWRVSRCNLHGTNFTASSGADGTGDLYRLENIDALVKVVGRQRADLVTGDGGFDFSRNYHAQERLSSRLICAEVYAALLLQKQGGAFVLKVYDLHLTTTLILVAILVDVYEEVHVTKPLASRPANSEKYIVCKGFRGCPESTLHMLREGLLSGADSMNMDEHQGAFLTLQLMEDVLAINEAFTQRQVGYIQRTLKLINDYDCSTEGQRQKMIDATHEMQKEHGLRFCRHYGVDAVS
jgi:23S rRNA U2552 (ribose-2'-O)-methylase RlmE/FtsJ